MECTRSGELGGPPEIMLRQRRHSLTSIELIITLNRDLIAARRIPLSK